MDLEKALEQFDATEANLRRLQAIWTELQGLMPSGIGFLDGGPEGRRYRELTHAYEEIVAAVPAIHGFRIETVPVALNAIGQMRFDAAELGEIELVVSTEDEIARPGTEIDEYRFRLDRARRDLVREHLSGLAARIDRLLADRVRRIAKDREPVSDAEWEELGTAFGQLERLAGDQIPRTKAWTQLQRHLAWHQGVDLHDIAESDWPAVRSEIQQNLYSELEPVPIAVEDLGSLAASKPEGTVTTALRWANLSAEEFERLIFNLISDADGYANPQWLMQTAAADRGRDLSVERDVRDALSGTTRERVIIQAKHWLTRSVAIPDLAGLAAQMELWGHPPVDVLIIATSGRFTVDAVDWVETHNGGGTRPRITMWPESHLELLLARRPHIAAAFHLR
jgi:Restriction endonuclease